MARVSSPAPNPGNVSTERSTEIDRSWMQGQLGSGSPQFELVALTATPVATVTTDCHIDREGSITARRGIIERTTSVPLIARSTRWLEREQIENILHRDLGSQPVEVDPGHGLPLLGLAEAGGSFRSLSLYGERGTILFEVSRHTANQPSCGVFGRFAPGTPEPRPDAGF